MKIFNFNQKKMKLLTKVQQKSYKNVFVKQNLKLNI